MKTTLPFSPLTMSGLGVRIEEHGMALTAATTGRRYPSPKVTADAVLLVDLCQARTDRAIALAFGSRSAA